MNVRILLLTLFSLRTIALGSEPKNMLEVWAKGYQRAKTSEPVLIALHATLSTHDGRHYLAFRLTNVSKRPLQCHHWDLPWGNSNAIQLAAFTTNGKCLENSYPIDDPPYEKPLTIAPGQSVRGEQPIAENVTDIDASRNRDTLVLWSYQFIDFSGPKRPQTAAVCTGVIVIPKSK